MIKSLFQTCGQGLLKRLGIARARLGAKISRHYGEAKGNGIYAFNLGVGFTGGFIGTALGIYSQIPVTSSPILNASLATLLPFGAFAGSEIMWRYASIPMGFAHALLSVANAAFDNGKGAADAWGLAYDTVKTMAVRGRTLGLSYRAIFSDTKVNKAIASHAFIAKHDVQGGVGFYGETSQDFRENVVSAWKAVPEAIRNLWGTYRFVLRAGGVGADVMDGTLGHRIMEPDEDDDRSQRNHLGGACLFGDKLAFVTEYSLKSSEDEKDESIPDLDGFLLKKWRKNENPKATVRHEVMHGLDKILEIMMGMKLSETAAFKTAYALDVENMGGYESARAKDYTYFVRKAEERGRQEVWAELGAEAMDGSNRGKKMAKDWKNTHAFMESFTKGFVGAYEQGLPSLMRYLDVMYGYAKEGNPKVSAITSMLWFKHLRQDTNCGQKEFQQWIDNSSSNVVGDLIFSVASDSFSDNIMPNDKEFFNFLKTTPEYVTVKNYYM